MKITIDQRFSALPALLTAGGCLLASFSGVHAANTVWNGTTGDWQDATWSSGLPSTKAGTQDFTEIQSGDVTYSATTGSTSSGRVAVGGASGAILNMTGGTLTLNDQFGRNDIYIGHQATASGTPSGTFNMTGGTLNGRGLVASVSDLGNGTVNFGATSAGGAPVLSLTGALSVAQLGTGVINLSGHGTIDASQLYMGFGSSVADGTLFVSGGNLSLNFGTGSLGRANRPANPLTIAYEIDSTGVSTLNFTGDVSFGRPDLTDNAMVFDLSLGGDYVHTISTTYTIIDSAGDFTDYGVFANVSDGDILTVGGNQFQANYITGAGNDQFTLTAIPEPSAFALLLGAVVGLLALRRRSA